MKRGLLYLLIAAGSTTLTYGLWLNYRPDATKAFNLKAQVRLSSELENIRWPKPHELQLKRPKARMLAAQAIRAFQHSLHPGQPIGRLFIPRLHIAGLVIVRGATDVSPEDSILRLGPVQYPQASLPGLGSVTAIAAHRTTYGAWFRHIDDLRPGDRVAVVMPYGTFRYRVYYHKVVVYNDWSILRHRSYEKLVLTACHPLYSASRRWVVFARLIGQPSRPLTGHRASLG